MFKIIIIEDNIKLRKRMKRIIISKLAFLSVAEASDEKETFSEIGEKRPDLVIIDIRLAGENGLNLTKKIKIQYPFMPAENRGLSVKIVSVDEETVRVDANHPLAGKTLIFNIELLEII